MRWLNAAIYERERPITDGASTYPSALIVYRIAIADDLAFVVDDLDTRVHGTS